MLRRLRGALFSGLLLSLCLPAAFAEANRPFDHSVWQEFLNRYVNAQGQVDYQGVKADPALLNQYLSSIRKIKSADYKMLWVREERIALFINLYHAALIRAVSRRYPVNEVHDIPNLWSEKTVRMGRSALSLDEIRKNQLMDVFRDEKIHFVLSCGAKSCPRLRQEAFTGPRVEGQMLLAVREFVNDPAKNQIIPGQKKIHISRLFKWYDQDFQMDFGTFENDQGYSQMDFSVLSFLFYYLEDQEKARYLETSKIKIRYLPFDWSLNDWVRTEAS